MSHSRNSSVIMARCCACMFGIVASAVGDTHYVAPDGGDSAPYTSWATAATNISDAIDASADGDTVVISNGVYGSSAAISIGKSITITGIRGDLTGARETIIDGNGQNFAGFQSAWATPVTAEIRGLTITNFGNRAFYSNAGVGVPVSFTIANCILTGSRSGKGAGLYAAQSSSLLITNCEVTGNTAGSTVYAGGGLYFDLAAGVTSRVENCLITRNSCTNNNCYGGGLMKIPSDGVLILDRCTISDNSSAQAGGMYIAGEGCRTLNCVISGNSTWGPAGQSYGGGICLNDGVVMDNCLLTGNSNANWRGGGAWCEGTMRNCTVVSNYSWQCGGIGGEGTSINCIAYYNSDSGNYFTNWFKEQPTLSGFFTNCCTAPDPANYLKGGIPQGTDCVDTNPLFEATAPDNFRPARESPCVNAGKNQEWMAGTKDIAGHSRIWEEIVDMGAYEHVPRGTVLVFR